MMHGLHYITLLIYLYHVHVCISLLYHRHVNHFSLVTWTQSTELAALGNNIHIISIHLNMYVAEDLRVMELLCKS